MPIITKNMTKRTLWSLIFRYLYPVSSNRMSAYPRSQSVGNVKELYLYVPNEVKFAVRRQVRLWNTSNNTGCI